jgi:hypothetical protein
MENANNRDIPWALFVSELIGTALLVLVGLSLVIFMFGTGNRLGTMGGLVDLLGRTDGRDALGRAGLQFPCEKNHGSEVVLF